MLIEYTAKYLTPDVNPERQYRTCGVSHLSGQMMGRACCGLENLELAGYWIFDRTHHTLEREPKSWGVVQVLVDRWMFVEHESKNWGAAATPTDWLKIGRKADSMRPYRLFALIAKSKVIIKILGRWRQGLNSAS